MERDVLSLLNKETDTAFDRKVKQTRSCHELVVATFKKTFHSINTVILRRFYRFVKSVCLLLHTGMMTFCSYFGFKGIDRCSEQRTLQSGKETKMSIGMISVIPHPNCLQPTFAVLEKGMNLLPLTGEAVDGKPDLALKTYRQAFPVECFPNKNVENMLSLFSAEFPGGINRSQKRHFDV